MNETDGKTRLAIITSVNGIFDHHNPSKYSNYWLKLSTMDIYNSL